MKRMKLLLVSLLAAIPLLGVSWVTAVQAQDFRTGPSATVPVGQTVDDTLFASGQTVDIAGTVEGDVFCAGQNITVSGRVTGDVICAGQTVVISGTVEGNARIAGQTLTISGTVERNLTAAGQSLTVTGQGSVGGDVSAGVQDAVFNGPIRRDLAVGATNVTINSEVTRDVQAEVQNLTLANSADVGGTIAYTSQQDLTRQSGAQVAGAITRQDPPAKEPSGSIIASSVLTTFALYLFVSMLIVALALVLLMPRAFQKGSNFAFANWGKTLLIGLLATVIVPLVIFALLITVVGIPLALIVLLAWLLLLVLSGPFAAYLLGRLILQKATNNAIWYMLLGAVIVLVVYFIPILNFLLMLAVVWFGVGMLLQMIPLRKPHYTVTDERVATTKPVVAAKK